MGNLGIPFRTIEIEEDEPMQWPRFEPERRAEPQPAPEPVAPTPRRDREAVPA